jgi:hypothetical protein
MSCRLLVALIATGMILPGLLLAPPAQPDPPRCEAPALVPPTDIGGGI